MAAAHKGLGNRCAPTPIKQYVLERLYGVKRMNGGFV